MYKREDPLIILPTEDRIDKVIASCLFRNVVAYTLLKETGMRPVELSNLTLQNVDLERGIIYVKTAKRGRNRSIKLKEKTKAMLTTFISKSKLGFGIKQKMFKSPETLEKVWQKARKRTAIKFQDPKIVMIRL